MDIDHRSVDLYAYHGARQCEMLYELLLTYEGSEKDVVERMCALAASAQAMFGQLSEALDPTVVTILPRTRIGATGDNVVPFPHRAY